ncbi:MAG: hypothetical protein IKN17_13605 [Ruminococcus sp.]|nr:hypothetical protein [Ruminococcus sp.]
MREKLKYFIINKAYDYNRGYCENMAVSGSRLCFSSEKGSGVGRFLTRVFDSGERGMNWHRLVINADDLDPAALRVTVYASDKDSIRYNGGTLTLSEFSELKDLTIDDRLKAFEPCAAKRASGVTDLLLHSVTGRYIWVFMELYNPDGRTAAINDIWIYLPAGSWIDHLPAIYRRSDADSHFLERYLGIFQTFYEELDREIADIAHRFDPECAETDFLEWLAKWLSISDTKIWSEDQLRELLLRAVSFYRRRGTKESLSELIELYTGEKPFITEGSDVSGVEDRALREEIEKTLCGAEPNTVTVLVRPGHDLRVIRRIALEMLPVTAQLNLVELDPYIFLGKHAYLGVNSALGQYRPAALDGRTRLTLTSLGGTPPPDEQPK